MVVSLTDSFQSRQAHHTMLNKNHAQCTFDTNSDLLISKKNSGTQSVVK